MMFEPEGAICMKWTKQMAAMLTAACMTTVCLPAAPIAELSPSAMLSVQAEEESPASQTEEESPTSGSCGENAAWTLDEDGTLTISGTGKVKHSEWESDAIRKIVIEEGVTGIGMAAFHHCGNLTAITLPESLEYIDTMAFEYCVKLPSVTLPVNVEKSGMPHSWAARRWRKSTS